MTIEIIAEVAQGYEGNPKLGELLALGALRSGVDAVKYQIIYADELAVPDYQYYDLFKSLEMDVDIWAGIADSILSDQKKLLFDVYGEKSLALAKQLNASGVKISTTDFSNKKLVRAALDAFEKVYISVGGIPISEVDELVDSVKDHQQITLMYGFQAEPTELEDNNLLRISSLRERYPAVDIGFMDHSAGDSNEVYFLPLMAASLGARVIEKHITLDPLLEIEDYISALEPARFEEFVATLRNMEAALGSGEFKLTPKEKEYRGKAGKVVVAMKNLDAGQKLTESDVVLKRVDQSTDEKYFFHTDDVIGITLKSPLSVNSPLTANFI